ncbi:MAG: MFS transporter, partial [Sphingomonadales bacterium]
SYGWRTGAFLASTLALLLAEYVGWSFAYSVMGLMVTFALLPAFLLGEPQRHKVTEKSDFLQDAIAPFKEFLTRHGAFIILAFVLLHKVGDTMANLMLRNLLVTLEFSKPEVAFYDVAVGQVALFAGIAVGGFLYARWGVAKSMLLSLFLMMISNLSFAVLAMIGHDVHFLAFTIGFENFASGVGGVIVVGYLSGLCNLAYTATQYALLSGAAAITGRFLTAPSGYLIDWVGFPVFYLITTVAAVPGIILFIFMIRNGFLGLEKMETPPKSTKIA